MVFIFLYFVLVVFICICCVFVLVFKSFFNGENIWEKYILCLFNIFMEWVIIGLFDFEDDIFVLDVIYLWVCEWWEK